LISQLSAGQTRRVTVRAHILNFIKVLRASQAVILKWSITSQATLMANIAFLIL